MTRESATEPSHRSLLTLFGTEAAIYGVILVSGMIIVMTRFEVEPWSMVIKVAGTVVVFWAAHVFAATIPHIGTDSAESVGGHVAHAMKHSVGMIVVAALPTVILTIGALGWIARDVSVWASMWGGILILATLGYLAVARRSPSRIRRALGALVTAGLGMLLMLLKAVIH